MKRITKPMGREDYAWLLACVICGLAVSAFVLIPEFIYENQKHYGTKWTFTTKDNGTASQSVEQFEVPVYTRKITIRTAGKPDDIIRVVCALKRNDIDINNEPISTPHTTFSDSMQVIIGAFLFFIVGTGLFRIVEKICRRIFGVKVLTDKIVGDPSTSSG